MPQKDIIHSNETENDYRIVSVTESSVKVSDLSDGRIYTWNRDHVKRQLSNKKFSLIRSSDIAKHAGDSRPRRS